MVGRLRRRAHLTLQHQALLLCYWIEVHGLPCYNAVFMAPMNSPVSKICQNSIAHSSFHLNVCRYVLSQKESLSLPQNNTGPTNVFFTYKPFLPKWLSSPSSCWQMLMLLQKLLYYVVLDAATSFCPSPSETPPWRKVIRGRITHLLAVALWILLHTLTQLSSVHLHDLFMQAHVFPWLTLANEHIQHMHLLTFLFILFLNMTE